MLNLKENRERAKLGIIKWLRELGIYNSNIIYIVLEGITKMLYKAGLNNPLRLELCHLKEGLFFAGNLYQTHHRLS